MKFITIELTAEWRNDNGELHREDGPAVECANGYKSWWLNNKRHRVDSPAIEDVSGETQWWFNGKLHRVDGPAIEWADGTKEWYYHGKYIDCQSQQQFEKLMKLKTFW